MTTNLTHLRCIAFLICCLLDYRCTSHTVDCTSEQLNCQNTIINCLPNQNCFVSCEDKQSCMGSVINCPLFGYCIIICRGKQACQDTIIDASSSNGNFNLLCDESTDTCKGTNIYGSTLDSNTGHFTVTCNGDKRSCFHSEIHCHRAGDCSISCDGETSCRWAQITGPSIKGKLDIHCNGKQSCFDAILDGRLSTSLDISGCTASGSCFDLTLYCPPNTNDHKNCFIEGNENIGEDNGGTKIYAINGFDDIDIEYSGSFGAQHNGKLFCGDHYDISCNIATDSWSCDDDEAECTYKIDQNLMSSTPEPPLVTQPITTIAHPTNNVNVIPSIYSTLSPSMIFKHNKHDQDVLLWTLELKVSFALFVVAMLLLLGLHCCKIKDRNIFKSTTNQRIVSINERKQATPSSKPDAKCVPIEQEIDNTHTIYLSVPKKEAPRTKATTPSYVIATTPSFDDPSHVMFDAISMTDVEQAIRRPSMSKESNLTNLSAAANASITDIKEKNILFLNYMERNRLYMSPVTQLKRGKNRGFDCSECDTETYAETSTSIQGTNSSETSVDSTDTSTESFPDDDGNHEREFFNIPLS